MTDKTKTELNRISHFLDMWSVQLREATVNLKNAMDAIGDSISTLNSLKKALTKTVKDLDNLNGS